MNGTMCKVTVISRRPHKILVLLVTARGVVFSQIFYKFAIACIRINCEYKLAVLLRVVCVRLTNTIFPLQMILSIYHVGCVEK